MKKILIIDDERELIKAISIRLKASGYEVITANNGFDGIDAAKREKPDAIVLDLIMPQFDGYETCKRLKSDPDTKSIPVIVCSAAGQKNVEADVNNIGANGFVAKPFDTIKLLETIKACMGGRLR
ncbi:MAG: hypothetical protein AUJ75_04595 [Candidatus Omnitrophica bacterium CG1_02_49_10]|nr:MAG: hypothetical protein AUJ75_04595 [Candidatus Omnitrophica bacterium CG1_02_49_10]